MNVNSYYPTPHALVYIAYLHLVEDEIYVSISGVEQGRLEPIQAYLKKNKRGLGADRVKKKTPQLPEKPDSDGKSDKVSFSFAIAFKQKPGI